MSKSTSRTPRKEKSKFQSTSLHVRTDLAPDKSKKLAIISCLETNKPVSYSDRAPVKADSQKKAARLSSNQRKLTESASKRPNKDETESNQYGSESDPSGWDTSQMGARLEVCIDTAQETRDDYDSFIEENEGSIAASLTSFGSVTSVNSPDYSNQTRSHTARCTASTTPQTRSQPTSAPQYWHHRRAVMMLKIKNVTKDREQEDASDHTIDYDESRSLDMAVSHCIGSILSKSTHKSRPQTVGARGKLCNITTIFTLS